MASYSYSIMHSFVHNVSIGLDCVKRNNSKQMNKCLMNVLTFIEKIACVQAGNIG